MRATNQDLARRPRSFVHAAVTAAAALGRRLRRPRRRTSPPSWLVGAPQACRRSEVCRTASALTTTSSPPLLLAPQARWRQHAVLALPGPRRLDCSLIRTYNYKDSRRAGTACVCVTGTACHSLAPLGAHTAHTACTSLPPGAPTTGSAQTSRWIASCRARSSP